MVDLAKVVVGTVAMVGLAIVANNYGKAKFDEGYTSGVKETTKALCLRAAQPDSAVIHRNGAMVYSHGGISFLDRTPAGDYDFERVFDKDTNVSCADYLTHGLDIAQAGDKLIATFGSGSVSPAIYLCLENMVEGFDGQIAYERCD